MEKLQKQAKWVFLESDNEKVENLIKTYNVSRPLAKTVLNRFDDEKDFFDCEKMHLNDPFLLNDMQKGVDTINESILKGEKIVVYGDYDVDGITSTYILTDYLKSIGANVSYYIPDRADEGYGLSMSSVETLKAEGVNCVVTVDLGISAIEEVKKLYEYGIKVVVTDHHSLSGDLIPSCEAVINPKIKSDYPFVNLAGVGVAFKLICALSDNDEDIIKKYLPYVAIGTVADLVELKDENRYIVKEGINLLKNTNNTGLKSLFEISNTNMENIDAKNIGFSIGPRLNAAGRLSCADVSVKLLMECDKEKADEIANALDNENNRRKEEEKNILDEALKIIMDKKLYENEVIVVSGYGWHHGVIGIVASRITDLFYKPSIIISTGDEEKSKASGRSIKGFNLFDALCHASSYLLKFGGHSLAAGLSVEKSKIEDFSKCINEYAKNIITKDIATYCISIDDTLNLNEITLDLIDEFKQLEPFGMGNRTPVFCLEKIKISEIRYSNAHAFVTATDGKNFITMPAFNMRDTLSSFAESDCIDVCGSLSVNTYLGREHPQFIIKDIRPSHTGFLTRESVLNVYMIIKNMLGAKKIDMPFCALADEFLSLYKAKISNIKLEKSLKVLKELMLIDYKIEDENIKVFEKVQFLKKTDLEKSKTFVKYSAKRGKANE
ncbi:MAG: single-stranded-DNA-specific exonuclease RecJ [Ruminococcaceae bacterium]|nr:single-stranded-DNA-specific exonuclease RecJ [Oscillospiraceae bacterium]